MLSYEFPPWGGGTGNACRRMLEVCREDPALAVDLVTSGAGDRLETEVFGESIRIHRVPIDKRSVHFWTISELAQWTWRAWKVGRRLVRRRDFALCHCWSGWPSGWIGHALRERLPYLVALRGSDVPGYSSRLTLLDPLVLRHLSRRVWRHASAVTAVSEHLRSLAQRTDPGLPIEVIGNGVDTSFFVPGRPGEEFSLLFVGRLIERKGVIHLLRAFHDLSAEGRPCRLAIVGDGPERARLEQSCRELGISDRVDFHGVLPHDRLRAVYQHASVFVMPALQEGMSNAVLEAMASGLPVVMTATGGSEAVRDNGAIVPAGDAAALRDALASYLDDPERRRRHGQASRERAEGMSWEVTSRAYLDLYRRILG